MQLLHVTEYPQQSPGPQYQLRARESNSRLTRLISSSSCPSSMSQSTTSCSPVQHIHTPVLNPALTHESACFSCFDYGRLARGRVCVPDVPYASCETTKVSEGGSWYCLPEANGWCGVVGHERSQTRARGHCFVSLVSLSLHHASAQLSSRAQPRVTHTRTITPTPTPSHERSQLRTASTRAPSRAVLPALRPIPAAGRPATVRWGQTAVLNGLWLQGGEV